MTQQSNAERFIDAFNRIEQILRSRAKADLKKRSFGEIVDKSKDVIPKQAVTLKAMADLRNVIVHTPFDSEGAILAEPRLTAVEWMEMQADLIERPPRVIDVLKMSPPKVFDVHDEISEFLREVSPPNNFSQSPFMDSEDKFKLITTNAVARWVAKNYEAKDGVVVAASTIGEVFESAELDDHLDLRAKGLKCVDAVRAFSGEHGIPPAAILITEPRGVAQVPLGICTRGDLPALYKALGV